MRRATASLRMSRFRCVVARALTTLAADVLLTLAPEISRIRRVSPSLPPPSRPITLLRSLMPATRCPWPTKPLDIAYHDTEWGVPVHGDVAIFEPGAFPTGFIGALIQPSDHSRDASNGDLIHAPQATMEGFEGAMALNPEQDPQNVADAIVAMISAPKARGNTATPRFASTSRKQAESDDEGNNETFGPTFSNSISFSSRYGRVCRAYVKTGRER